MTVSMHDLTPRNLANLEQDVGVHLASWLGTSNNGVLESHQHSSEPPTMQNRHAILAQALTVARQALTIL